MGNRKVIVAFFGLSLLAHVVFVRFCSLDSASVNARELEVAAHREVIPVKVWVKEEKPLGAAEAEMRDAHQVIELPPGPDEQPEHAKYLAERAMTADKETMARPGAPFAGRGSAPVPSRDLFIPEAAGSEKSGAGQQGRGALAPDRLKLKPVEAAELFEKDAGRPPAGGFGGAGYQGGGIDFLGGAATGEVTVANAYKFKHAAFFNELKRSVAFYWNPQPALWLIPPVNQDLVTLVRFVLNADGSLSEIEVLSSSGYDAVDRAALSAIRNCVPVFGIPEDLLDQNGRLAINFGFVIVFAPESGQGPRR